MFDNIVTYFSLKDVNEYLSVENSGLKNGDIQFYQKSFDRNVIHHDSSFAQEFAFSNAKIIRNSTNHRNNYLTLNKGKMNGILPGMGVVSNLGIIGIVIESSKGFSAVMSVLNKEFKLSAKVQKSGYFGSVIWNGKDYRTGTLKDIPNHVSLLENDTIVTSGFSGIFPAGIPIGTVKTVTRLKGSGFLDVEILFTEDYRRVAYVHVIKYLLKTERLEIESKIPTDD